VRIRRSEEVHRESDRNSSCRAVVVLRQLGC
jgi:hypothetical protein